MGAGRGVNSHCRGYGAGRPSLDLLKQRGRHSAGIPWIRRWRQLGLGRGPWPRTGLFLFVADWGAFVPASVGGGDGAQGSRTYLPITHLPDGPKR